MLPKPKRSKNSALLEDVRSCPCLICRGRDSDAHHIRTRGAGGGDNWWNVIPLCRAHHTEWHNIGAIRFLNRYPDALEFLGKLGWQLNGGILFHVD